MLFDFSSVYVMNNMYLFVYVKPTLHPKDEANMIVVNKVCYVLSDSVCLYFIEDFCINIHQGYWSEVFVVVVVSLPSYDICMILAL